MEAFLGLNDSKIKKHFSSEDIFDIYRMEKLQRKKLGLPDDVVDSFERVLEWIEYSRQAWKDDVSDVSEIAIK